MSETKNRALAERWLRTAEEDLSAARLLHKGAKYAQVFFLCQQCGEKAIKAIWYLEDGDPRGHSVQRLVGAFPGRIPAGQLEGRIEDGALLDELYIPTRYPSGLPGLTPGQVYRRSDADRALEAADRLLTGCREHLEGPGGTGGEPLG